MNIKYRRSAVCSAQSPSKLTETSLHINYIVKKTRSTLVLFEYCSCFYFFILLYLSFLKINKVIIKPIIIVIEYNINPLFAPYESIMFPNALISSICNSILIMFQIDINFPILFEFTVFIVNVLIMIRILGPIIPKINNSV